MSEVEFRDNNYPRIKTYIGGVYNRGDLCVLFTSPRTGTCLFDKLNTNRFGEYNIDWREELFVLHEDIIIVSNKIIRTKQDTQF